MSNPKTPASLPEDEDMDPVGQPYQDQAATAPENGDDPPHPPFSPDNEPDIAPE